MSEYNLETIGDGFTGMNFETCENNHSACLVIFRSAPTHARVTNKDDPP